MGGAVNMIDPSGAVYAVPEEKVAGAQAQGFKIESGSQEAARTEGAIREEQYGGVGGKAAAFGAGALSGLTLGASDVLLSEVDDLGTLRTVREVNPGATAAGQIAGALAPALVTGGAGAGSALLRASPAGIAARAGARIAEAGAGSGALARAGYAAAGAGVEGALQNAGAYIGQMAIEDKELAADGFIGAMGKGALYGGVAGGALSLAGSGLVAARRLLPKEEVTAAAVQKSEQEAIQAIDSALEQESREAMRATRARLQQIREETAALDAKVRTELDAIAGDKTREIATHDARLAGTRTASARADVELARAERALKKLGSAKDRGLAEANARAAMARAEEAVARTERAKTGLGARKTRKAFGGDEVAPAADDPIAAMEARIARGEVPGEAGPFSPKGLRAAAEREVKREQARATVGGFDPFSSPAGQVVRDVERGAVGAVKPRVAGAADEALDLGAAGRALDDLDAGAARAAPAADDGGNLLAALQGTKAGLDEGKTLASLSAAKRETFVEDALNAHVAQTSPEAQRLLAHLGDLEESRDAMAAWIAKYSGPRGSKVKAFEYAEGMRKPGYSSVTVEGTPAVPRARSYEFRGTEAERVAADAKTMAKLRPEERIAADEAVAARFGAPKTTAADIVAASEREVAEKAAGTLDEQIGQALRARPEAPEAFADDLDDVIATIGKFEQKMADVADELGPMAPPKVAERAKGYREAQARQSEAGARAAADAAADADKAAATIALGEVPGKPGLRGMAQKAADAGSFLEALQMLGVPVPDASNIPLIGPLVGAYLKARLAGKVFRRMGGKVPETAETVIAGKASAIRQRVTAAIDKALEVGAKGVTAAAPKSGGVAAVLGHKLFDDGEPGQSEAYTSEPKKGDLLELYRARADELQRAMQPGAIREAVRKRVRASDPTVLDAIVAAEERKLRLLYDELPRPHGPPGLLDGQRTYVPSMAGLSRFARVVSAVDDPAAVIEQAAAGAPVAPEAARAVRTVYPRLIGEAQRRLIERSVDLEKPMGLAHKVALSRLLGMPLDRSMEPAYAAFLQRGHTAEPSPPTPQPAMGQPTISADVRIGARVDPFGEGASP